MRLSSITIGYGSDGTSYSFSGHVSRRRDGSAEGLFHYCMSDCCSGHERVQRMSGCDDFGMGVLVLFAEFFLGGKPVPGLFNGSFVEEGLTEAMTRPGNRQRMAKLISDLKRAIDQDEDFESTVTFAP